MLRCQSCKARPSLRLNTIMGPSIVLDKSALQALPQRAIYELSRYFFTNVTPVLLMEILADLRLDEMTLAEAQAVVAMLARKVLPFDAFKNAEYQWLCLADLLGGRIKMDRRPVVAGGQNVVTKDGRAGVHFGIQPEHEALMRWRAGEFSSAD